MSTLATTKESATCNKFLFSLKNAGWVTVSLDILSYSTPNTQAVFPCNYMYTGCLLNCAVSATDENYTKTETINLVVSLNLIKLFRTIGCNPDDDSVFNVVTNLNYMGVMPWIWSGQIKPSDVFDIGIKSGDLNAFKRDLSAEDSAVSDLLNYAAAKAWDILLYEKFKPSANSNFRGRAALNQVHGYGATYAEIDTEVAKKVSIKESTKKVAGEQRYCKGMFKWPKEYYGKSSRSYLDEDEMVLRKAWNRENESWLKANRYYGGF